jgi:cell wall-associated NlpC family hydrolase
MTFHFDNAEPRQLLCNAAAEWLHTPFRPFSRAKGIDGGIDCIGLVEEMMIAAGVVQHGDFAFDRASADYQSNRLELRVLKMLRGAYPDDPQSQRLSSIFTELRLPEDRENLHPAIFMPGDLLVLRQGGQFHMPIMLEGRRFVHCAQPMGVDYGDLHDTTYSQHIDAAFRAMNRA